MKSHDQYSILIFHL